MKINNKIIRLKRFVKQIVIASEARQSQRMARLKAGKPISLLLALTIILSLFLVAVPMAGIAEAEDYYVRTDGNNSNDGLVNNAAHAWLTIQYAVDTVVAGDTIEVAAGTYKERIIIEKELVIQSTDGAENTIIDGDGVCNNVVNIWHKNVTFEGFTVTNPTAGACDDAGGIYVQHPSNLDALLVNNVYVLNNIVEATKSASEGTSSYGPAGIVIGPSSNVTVSGNIIRNLHNCPDVEADHTTGINVWGNDEASKPFDIVISGNVISDTDDYGILLQYAHNVQIENNSVTECEVGIRVDPFMGATVSDLTIKYNNLFGNTEYGVLNTMEDEIDATDNWWGDATGPYHVTTNSLGQGNAVSDNVDFIPFLGSSGGEVVDKVSITKSGPTSANSGDDITYTITYKNIGTDYATNIIITETYPLEVEYVSANPAPDIGNNQWNIVTLAPNEEDTITITVHIK